MERTKNRLPWRWLEVESIDVNLPIRVKGFESVGVTVIPSTAADFDSRVRAMFPNGAPVVLALKPYLVFVSNRSPRTIVGYNVLFKVTFKDGRSRNTFTQFKYPDAVLKIGTEAVFPRGREVYPGEQRLVGNGFEIHGEEYLEDYRDWGLQGIARLRNATGLSIELNAVIFEDGVLLGPDTSGLDARTGTFSEHFSAYLKANQHLYRTLVEGIESGHSVEEVFRPLDTRAEPPLGDPFGIYPQLAAEAACKWRRRLGDQAIFDALKKALREHSFMIRRSSDPLT
jgi:hypothetical protein